MMKKIFALLVVFAMALCFASCGGATDPEETPCTNHVDNNGDGKCDTEGCGADVKNNGDATVEDLAKELVGEGASLSKVTAYGEYVKDVFVDQGGKGYVVHLLVMSQYGTPETETLVYINAEGKLAGVKKMIWKTSDAMYGYVPPEASVVDAFYAKLTGKTAEEFAAAFTGEGVELVTNATSTSTKLVASIMEAFEVVETIKAGAAFPVNPSLATAYVNAIWAVVENAKTINATIKIAQSQDMSDMVDTEGDTLYEGFSREVTATIDVTLAMTENGLNVKMIGDAEEDGESAKIEAYIVDGIGYSRSQYDGEWDEWVVSPIELPEEATGMIEQVTAIIAGILPEDFEVTPEMIEEVKAVVSTAVSALMTINPDGSFGAKVDAKVGYDAVIEFIKSIKKDDTVGATINKVLAMVDPTITVEAILDEIGTYGAVTVGEIYTAINDAITAEFGMSINDIKNAILAEEAIVALIIENEIFDAETLAAIAETDIDVMIAEYAEMTIDDIVYYVLMAQSSEPMPNPEDMPLDEATPVDESESEEMPEDEEPVDTTGTLAAMITELKAMLAMTVEEAIGIDYDVFMEALDMKKINEQYAYVNFKIADDLAIEKIEFGMKNDTVTTTVTQQDKYVEHEDGSYEYVPVECTVTIAQMQEIVCTITSVSNTETVITAPEVDQTPDVETPAA